MMHHRQFVLEPDVDYPLYVTAKQYWHPAVEANLEDPAAFTLIVLHSTSFHKETWEPTLQHFFDNVQRNPSYQINLKFRCAWVIECPNHGESAVLNDYALQRPPFYRTFGCERYAEAVHRFMLRAPTLATPVDFRKQQLIGVGHSLGAVSISILPTLEPTFKFSALLLVEPLLSPGGIERLRDLKVNLIKSAYERRDVWPTREDASNYLRRRIRWDADVLDIYARFGLRACRAPEEAPVPSRTVTLACSREEEVTMYQDLTGPVKGFESLTNLCALIPVGVIFGGKNDYIPRDIQDDLVDSASGRHFGVISRIQGVGHLIPQHVPAKLGRALLDVLRKLMAPVDTCKL